MISNFLLGIFIFSSFIIKFLMIGGAGTRRESPYPDGRMGNVCVGCGRWPRARGTNWHNRWTLQSRQQSTLHGFYWNEDKTPHISSGWILRL